ncbi:MAG: hypothetical protein WB624_24885 [Xanthobacteraceae bacterium]|jgi:hypothetical protein
MNAKLKREPVVINQRRVHGDLVFATNRDRGLYIGTSTMDQPRWLEEHPGSWQRIEDVQREAASPAPPVENENNAGAAPAGPNDQTSSGDIRKDGDEDDAIALIDILPGDCSPPYKPTPLPTPVKANVPNGSTKAELLPLTKAAVSETKGPKTETTPLGAMGRKRGRRGGRQPKKQKLPAEISKAGRKLACMLLFLDSLAEYGVISYAARKAGIHRKTAAYWKKRSEAGDDGYDLEWRGETRKFHEHYESAIEELPDKLTGLLYELAMGGVVYKTDPLLVDLGHQGPDAYLRDENGNPVVETVLEKNPKMIRFFLELRLPDEFGKRRKIDRPQKGGVLVVGAAPKKLKTSAATAASIKARRWKTAARMIRQAKP